MPDQREGRQAPVAQTSDARGVARQHQAKPEVDEVRRTRELEREEEHLARVEDRAHAERGKSEHLNMIVPIDLLKPIFDDLLTLGQRNRPPRPWLGLYATEVDNRVVVVGLSNRGPAKRSNLRTGDVVLAVGGQEVNDLAGLFRRIWSLGDAGVEVPMTIYREGQALELKVASADRRRFLKSPRLH